MNSRLAVLIMAITCTNTVLPYTWRFLNRTDMVFNISLTTSLPLCKDAAYIQLLPGRAQQGKTTGLCIGACFNEISFHEKGANARLVRTFKLPLLKGCKGIDYTLVVRGKHQELELVDTKEFEKSWDQAHVDYYTKDLIFLNTNYKDPAEVTQVGDVTQIGGVSYIKKSSKKE